MNRYIATGNLGKDPESKKVGEKTVTKFSLAVSDGFGDKKKTFWFNVVAWEKLGDTAKKFLKKGSKVLVEGRLTSREADDKTYYDVVAEKIEFLDPKSTESKPEKSAEITDDDIPF